MSTQPAQTTAPVLSYTSPGTPSQKPSAWSPLRYPIFRALWIAYMVSLIGTWAREAGGQWLIKELTGPAGDAPKYLGYLRMASDLPIGFLSIAAGVFADVYDRRKLLILCNGLMFAVSLILGLVTLSGHVTAGSVLGLTVLLGVGAALAGPAFQYVLPEVVPPADLPHAIGLNSVALNVARAAGPALGMLAVGLAAKWLHSGTRGSGASFLINAAAFIGVIGVLISWRRPPQTHAARPETVASATRTAFRYTWHSPALRAILVRVAAFILCASSIWTQLSIFSTRVLHGAEREFGILMAAVGVGAVIGVVAMPYLDKLLSTDGMVALCTAVFGLALMAFSQARSITAASAACVIIGFNWVVVPTNFNIATQRSVPGWVKGRAIAMYMTVLWGSMGIGGFIWGSVTTAIGNATGSPIEGITYSYLISGVLILAGLVLVKRYPLTINKNVDLRPATSFWPAPSLAGDPEPNAGPVLVTIEWLIDPANVDQFSRLMQQVKLQRLRDGASHWGLFDSPSAAGHFREQFLVNTWAEVQRQQKRLTQVDAAIERQALALHIGPNPPVISHWLHARNVAEENGAAANGAAATVATDRFAPIVDRLAVELRLFAERYRRGGGSNNGSRKG